MHIHQYHINAETGDIQQTISLGFYDRSLQPQQSEDQVLEATALGNGAVAASKLYVKSLYTGGSKCSLEGQVSPWMQDYHFLCSEACW